MRYRSNITFTLFGILFDIDGSNIYRILTQIESILVKKLHIEKDPTLTEKKLKQVLQSDNNTQKSDKFLVVNTTAIEIQRPSKNLN